MKNKTRIDKKLDKNDCTYTEFRQVFNKNATLALDSVYQRLKDRDLHPLGSFDKAGRFYLHDDIRHLSTSRDPSRAHPYSEMAEGRTRKFLIKVWIDKDCKNEQDLIKACC